MLDVSCHSVVVSKTDSHFTRCMNGVIQTVILNGGEIEIAKLGGSDTASSGLLRNNRYGHDRAGTVTAD